MHAKVSLGYVYPLKLNNGTKNKMTNSSNVHKGETRKQKMIKWHRLD